MKLLPFDFDRIDINHILITNISGESSIMDKIEFEALCNEDFEWIADTKLNELIAKNFLTPDESLALSIDLLANKLRSRKDYLRYFTSLHMIVLTLRCNCMCSYCHASHLRLE